MKPNKYVLLNKASLTGSKSGVAVIYNDNLGIAQKLKHKLNAFVVNISCVMTKTA